jgi:hypothetical protein
VRNQQQQQKKKNAEEEEGSEGTRDESMSAVESLLVDSDDDDLGDIDLTAITLEDILREEELAAQGGGDPANKAEASTLEDDLFFSPATFTLSIAPVAGMEVVKASGAAASSSAAVKKVDRAKSLTEMNVGGNAAMVTGAATSNTANGSSAQTQFRSPLEIAEAREQQLLSCVGVELISPLQVKRRLRANARTKKKSSKQKAKKKVISITSADATPAEKKQTKSTGVVKVQAMESISRQLRKNIEFKEYGPGSPTVVAIHSKFIAIGTSKGLVIIFDHFQNVRKWAFGDA